MDIITYIKGQFSGYTIFLILLSSYIMIFNDSRQLKQVKLKREARFSFLGGIAYAALALTFLFISIFV